MGTKRRRGRGRDVLLWAAGLFLLVQLAAGWAIDVAGLPVRFPYAAGVLGRLAGQAPPRVVVFGSSRIGTAVRCDVLDACLRPVTGDPSLHAFHGAVLGGDLTTSDFMLAQVLKMGVVPEVVLVEVSPELLAERNQWQHQHVHRQVTWANTPAHWGDIVRAGKVRRYLAGRLLPLHVHRYQLGKESLRLLRDGWDNWAEPYRLALRLGAAPEPAPESVPVKQPGHPPPLLTIPSHLTPRTPNVADRVPGPESRAPILLATCDPPPPPGWDPDTTPSPLGVSVSTAVRLGVKDVRRWLRGYHPGGGASAALENIFKRCEKYQIKVVLVLTPVARAHRELYTPAVEQAFHGRLGELTGRYEFLVVDGRAVLPDHCLVDNHHLTDGGGRLFSEALAREVGPLLRAGR